MSTASSLAQGELFRDHALDKLSRAYPDWIGKVIRAVWWIPAGTEFTTDRLWNLAVAQGWGKPPEPRAMGAAIKCASSEGLIVGTGRYEKSTRPECHARPVAVWRRA